METNKAQEIKDSLSNKSYRWTIFGVFIALVFGAFAIYTFLYRPKPNLSFIVTSTTNVLDINAPLSNMDILLDSVSLKDQNKNIKILSIRIINNGTANITPELYDSYMPILLNVTGGNILEMPEIVSTSDDEYLKTTLQSRITIKKDSLVVIPNIILDVEEYADIKLLVLHSNDSIPKIHVSGKISGQKEICVSEIENKPQRTFWDKVIPLSIDVFFTQLIAYAILIFLGLFIIAMLFTYVPQMMFESNRRRGVKFFKKNNSVKLIDSSIINAYIGYGAYFIEESKNLIEDNEQCLSFFRILQDKKEVLLSEKEKFEVFTFLFDCDIIRFDDNGEISFRQSSKELIETFYVFLSDNGGLHDHHLRIFSNKK